MNETNPPRSKPLTLVTIEGPKPKGFSIPAQPAWMARLDAAVKSNEAREAAKKAAWERKRARAAAFKAGGK